MGNETETAAAMAAHAALVELADAYQDKEKHYTQRFVAEMDREYAERSDPCRADLIRCLRRCDAAIDVLVMIGRALSQTRTEAA